MAQQQVHDMTGRECGVCGHKFTRSSLNLTISEKQSAGLVVATRVCGRCWNKHYNKGEE